MELKQESTNLTDALKYLLLIVPYGIETMFLQNK